MKFVTLLFWFAYHELYTPKWSNHIFDEWKIDINQDKALQAFKDLVLNRTNPDLDEYQILDRLRKIGLVDSANYIQSLI